MRLDGDAALALEIHRVEHLRFHLAGLKRAGDLEKPVGERRFAVIDVRDDGEIPDVGLIHRGPIKKLYLSGGTASPCGPRRHGGGSEYFSVPRRQTPSSEYVRSVRLQPDLPHL